MSVGGIVTAATARLAAAGVEQPGLDARVLIGTALGVDRAALVSRRNEVLEATALARIWATIERRAQREPVGRILGVREFWSLAFLLSPGTLEPRPDSETVVEAALAACGPGEGAFSVLDLGTGTGCLLLAILSERPEAYGLGIDLSADAVATAGINAGRLGLAARSRFVCADWRSWPGEAEAFDLVVANPPYVAESEMATLAPEVARFDPTPALVGGGDGLAAYRDLAPRIISWLRPGGTAVLEHGAGQRPAVTALMTAAGLTLIAAHDDLGGRDRCLVVRRPRLAPS